MNAWEQKNARMTLLKELMVLSEQYKHENNMNGAMKGIIFYICRIGASAVPCGLS